MRLKIKSKNIIFLIIFLILVGLIAKKALATALEWVIAKDAGSNLTFYYNDAAPSLTILTNGNANLTGTMTATSFVGNGSGLTNVAGVNRASVSGVGTLTSSSSYVDMAGMSITVTTGSAPVFIYVWIPSTFPSVESNGTFQIVIDGVPKQVVSQGYVNVNSTAVIITIADFETALSPGLPHTIKVQFKISGGATLQAGGGRIVVFY